MCLINVQYFLSILACLFVFSFCGSGVCVFLSWIFNVCTVNNTDDALISVISRHVHVTIVIMGKL